MNQEDIFVVFLILLQMLWVSFYLDWYWLWFCCKLPLLCYIFSLSRTCLSQLPLLCSIDLVMLSFSFESEKGFISLFVDPLFVNVSVSMSLSTFCCCCCCWSRMQGVISIFRHLLRLALCPSVWSTLKKVPWGAEKKMYSFVFGWNIL